MNPRNLAVYRFSRPAVSTTHTPLHFTRSPSGGLTNAYFIIPNFYAVCSRAVCLINSSAVCAYCMGRFCPFHDVLNFSQKARRSMSSVWHSGTRVSYGVTIRYFHEWVRHAVTSLGPNTKIHVFLPPQLSYLFCGLEIWGPSIQ